MRRSVSNNQSCLVMTDDPGYNRRGLMIMRWLAALWIVLAIESGADALSIQGYAQRRQSNQRTTSKADLQARLRSADQYREQGDYGRAAQEYQKLIQLAPRFACGSPKVRLLCIFNDFIKLPDARTGDAIRRLRRFRSPLPNPAVAWLSAQEPPSRALNGFGSDDNIGGSFSKALPMIPA